MTDLQKLHFFVIHVNIFYSRALENNEVEYYPAEIAIVEFSLEKGVLRTYNEIINEKVRIGFASSAKEYSSNFHHIPIDAPFGKNDYKEIFSDICSFLEPGKKDGKLPPLYTMFSKENAYYPAKSVLGRLATANRKNNLIFFFNYMRIIYCLDKVQVFQQKERMIIYVCIHWKICLLLYITLLLTKQGSIKLNLL